MNPSLPFVLTVFLGSAVVVVFAGVALARAADVIAASTRTGDLWLGAILLATATSLPELTTDLAAVLMGAPDIAAGDIFGSSMANMLILALVSFMPAGSALFQKSALDQTLTAALAIALTALAALFVLTAPLFVVAGVDVATLALAALFLVGARAIFVRGSLIGKAVAETELVEEGAESNGRELHRAIWRFAGAAAAIFVAAPVFAFAAVRVAEVSGLGNTVVGTWLVGLATSLPELVTAMTAVRLGAYDLAVGNLFGSNAVNTLLFVPLDVAHRQGSLFAALDSAHAVSALVATVLMATALAALVFRVRSRASVFLPGPMAIVLLYLMGLWAILARGR